jgi:hypothetical protein
MMQKSGVFALVGILLKSFLAVLPIAEIRHLAAIGIVLE